MPLDWAGEGGGNEDHPFVQARRNVFVSARENSPINMFPGFYVVSDFSVVSDQRGEGRMVSFIHGPHVSFGERFTTEVPGVPTEGDAIRTYNRLTWNGVDTDPVAMIGGDFLGSQNNVLFVPIAYVGYTPIPE